MTGSPPPGTGRFSSRAITVAAFLAPLLALAAILSYPPTAAWVRSFDTTRLHGRDVSDKAWTARFTLSDPQGQTRSAQDYQGSVLLLAFGYTHCPDACPTTLARLARVKELLGHDAAKVRVVFVTIDPDRDGAELLRNYTTAFDPSFVGLRGDDARTDEAAGSFHADYHIIRHGQDILVEHTVDTYLVDSSGRIRVVLPFDLSARDVADDTRAILRDSGLLWPWS